MKKSIPIIALGVILLCIGGFLAISNNKSNNNNNNKEQGQGQDEPKKEEEPIYDENIFINEDDGFRYIKIIEEDGALYITARQREYIVENDFLTEKDHGLKYIFTLNDNVYESPENEIKITKNGDSLIFDNNTDYSYLNGIYVNKNLVDRYSFGDYQKDSLIGKYGETPKELNQSTIINFYINESDDPNYYNISGYISKNKKSYILGENKIEASTGKMSDFENDYYFTIKDDVLIVQAQKDGKDVDSILNGEYPKTNSIKYKDIIESMEEMNPYGEGIQGNYY